MPPIANHATCVQHGLYSHLRPSPRRPQISLHSRWLSHNHHHRPRRRCWLETMCSMLKDIQQAINPTRPASSVAIATASAPMAVTYGDTVSCEPKDHVYALAASLQSSEGAVSRPLIKIENEWDRSRLEEMLARALAVGYGGKF
ncbi:hypothetical protein IAR50_003934 [Cryptococcus sp. DSM 104548]